MFHFTPNFCFETLAHELIIKLHGESTFLLIVEVASQCQLHASWQTFLSLSRLLALEDQFFQKPFQIYFSVLLTVF